MKTNKDKIVMHALSGSIHHPRSKGDGYWVGHDGIGRISMSTGSITYNFKIGDSCMEIAGDHIEPGVSLQNRDAQENNALMAFSCIGNEAVVISGEAKGRKGFVTGKHGGVDHVIVYFDQETLELLQIDDRIAIRSYGQGLLLLDHPEITVMNIDPRLLDRISITESADGTLEVPVKTVIPAHLMGAGLGATTLMNGDYDIMTQDKEANRVYGIDQLRFGDFVYIEDHDCRYGGHYKKGSGSIGVIVHSDSYTSGHGPGVCIVMTSSQALLKPRIDEHANLADLLLK